jgi:hypothetical protein
MTIKHLLVLDWNVCYNYLCESVYSVMFAQIWSGKLYRPSYLLGTPLYGRNNYME